MAIKNKKPIDTIEIEGEILNTVSYAVYFCRQQLFTSFRIFNRDVENVTSLTVSVTGSTPLILATETTIEEIPHESSMEAIPENVLNPKYLAELSSPETCSVQVILTHEKNIICTLEAQVLALPINYWGGLSGNSEMLAAFVRPKISDCQKIMAEAGLQLRTWGYSSEFSGYSGTDKNGVRNAAASVFSAVRRLNIERGGECDLSAPVCTGDITDIIPKKKATAIELALFAASCLEYAKLNPVILIGKSKICVGVWLYESCFSYSLQDDMQLVEKYVTEGVNNLTLFEAEDLFAHKNASYTTSEAHVRANLGKGDYELLIDIKRCRIGGIYPLPLKVKTAAGYELLADRQISFDEKPQEMFDAGKYEYDKAGTKDATWQRRLLDLSLKNNLLNFRYNRDCLHIIAPDLEAFCAKLEEKGKFTLLPDVSVSHGNVFFGNDKSVNDGVGELVSLEMKGGKLHTFSTQENMTDVAATLIRKARSAEEEAGANTLYLALGFLKWKQEGDSEDKFAPIALLPVSLKRVKSVGIQLLAGEDYEVNTTLLEFLKQDFGIDIRGVDGKGLSPKEIIAVMRAKTANMKGWFVYEDVYLAQFTFARYAMWADVKNNITTFAKNPLIASLMTNTNKLASNKICAEEEDDGDPCDVLTPLPCDSAQFSAVAESAKGTTFVLHGPPGTGKSQTISNIIANALDKGKRVLFVAEKQAALQVVKKRLSDIGIGEFCLELHSGKSADKSEIIRNIETTLALAAEDPGNRFAETGAKIKETREALRAPLQALHKKRRLGVSVYEGIVYYLQNKSAPDILNIETTFYDSLTKQKFEDYESMLSSAQAAAKECGGVYRSPFTEVRLTECGENTQKAVVCAAEVLLAELKHLKNYLGIFLDTFNQKVSKFTSKKLENLVTIAETLKSGSLKRFFECDEESLYKFYNANLRYDSEVKHWLKHFKVLPDISKFADELEKELDNWGENYRSSRVILQVLKRINRCGAAVSEKDELEWIKRAYEIEKARERIISNTDLSAAFVGFGGINDKKREEFLKPLYEMHKMCAQTFMDYNADAFNSICVAASGGALKPLINGIIGAAKAFTESVNDFVKVIKADKSSFEDMDIFECYTEKCTALIDNIDLLPSWCIYKAAAKKMSESGLSFMTDAMESGRISGKQVLSAFRKNVYRNFIQTNIPADESLSAFSASILDENASAFSRLLEEFTFLTREKIRYDLISRLPEKETEGALALELMSFQRQVKGNLRALNLRTLFSEIPELMKVVAPCMLMSPGTVSQYLPADPELFDIVIFDEASQIPTCEAIPSLARAKSAIIVGDPKQMPPTSFFMGSGLDDEHPEAEDLESVLEDCLALGIPEKHLVWHYRSKHESLIAFSNIMYYSSKLCTFPSPDALDSKVTLKFIENGVYERGLSKCNKEEAEALVNEVIRRLKDEKLRRSSIGIVTFSTPQQVYVEKLLNKAVVKYGLEEAAYEGEEPIFVKNLENVQGDERDIILFSVCYGPDKMGKISLNFGPLNQFGGWRRLNVAVSRAREEMVVFSSMRYSMIDLSRTTSRGVAGLKAFLEFAEKGRTSISVKSGEVILNRQGIGKFIAEELSNYGYECRCDVGVSDFKIDVGVVNPKNKHEFILGVLCDGTTRFSVKDRSVMQVQTLKRNNWNVFRLYAINFFNNPKREIKKIKDFLDKLTAEGGHSSAINFKKPYRAAKLEVKEVSPEYILSGEHDEEIIKILKAVVSAEEPISTQFLMKRTLSAFGITKYGIKLESKLRFLIEKCAFESCEMLGNVYYFKSAKFDAFDRCRIESGANIRTSDTDFTPYDVISLIRGMLLSKVSMYADELIPAVIKELKVPRASDKLSSLVLGCIDEGVKHGIFIRSISDKISLV